MITIKDFAEQQHISYETARRWAVNYAKELSGHISKQGRVQYLDEYAVRFLINKRVDNPVVVVDQVRKDEAAQLHAQLESLQAQLLAAQQRIIEMQQAQQQMIEDRARLQGLLEAHTQTEQELKAAQTALIQAKAEAQTELSKAQVEAQAELSKAKAEAQAELLSMQVQAKAETDSLRAQLAAAEADAQSYVRTWFGFYRKKGGKQK